MTQGKVITLKMMVTEMGDRGSKSVIYFFLPPYPSKGKWLCSTWIELGYYCKRATSRQFFNQVYICYIDDYFFDCKVYSSRREIRFQDQIKRDSIYYSEYNPRLKFLQRPDLFTGFKLLYGLFNSSSLPFPLISLIGKGKRL